MGKFQSHITIDEEKRFGKPCIRGMRISVGDILGWLSVEMTREDIMEDFPGVTNEDINAALDYASNYFNTAKNFKHLINEQNNQK